MWENKYRCVIGARGAFPETGNSLSMPPENVLLTAA
jgi:hypothetical protein